NLRLVAAALRLGRLGDLVVRDELRPALVGRDLRERGGQGRLAVVDVPDRAHVDVRLAAVEFFFGHVVCVLVYLLNVSLTLHSIAATIDGEGWLATRSASPVPSARLRALRSGGHPSHDRERRVEPMTRIELVTSSLPRTRSAN